MTASSFDLPTRITHWALALCVVLNFFLIEQGSAIHNWIGYFAVVFVLFRFGWNFKSVRPKHPNIAAKLIYLAIWLLVIALGVTGFMMEEIDRYWGEEWLEELHANISSGLQILVALHLAGVALDSIRHRRPTWKSMITGHTYH